MKTSKQIESPEATEKAKMMFKLLESDQENILKLYKAFSNE